MHDRKDTPNPDGDASKGECHVAPTASGASLRTGTGLVLFGVPSGSGPIGTRELFPVVEAAGIEPA